MDNSRNQLIVSAVYCLLVTYVTPAIAYEGEPILNGATNGTIGPKNRIETPLERMVRNNDMPNIQESRRIDVAKKNDFDHVLKNLASRSQTKELPLTSKLRIEMPLEKSLNPRAHLLANTSSGNTKSKPERDLNNSIDFRWAKASEKRKDNRQRKERPGLINWHLNMNEAYTASSHSGKPVLLVHILGNLDDHFC